MPLPSASTSRVRPILVIGATAAIITGVLLAAAGQLLNDADTYWHVAVGADILSTRSLPTVDVYSFTVAGQPWIAKEWLSQVLLGAAHAWAGWSAVAALVAISAGVAFGLLATFLIERLTLVPTIVLTGVALVLAAPHLLARPHVLALPFLVAWSMAVVDAADRRDAPSWWALPLMVVWANLHGSFLFGIVLAIGLGAEAVGRAERRRLATVSRWGGFVALSIGATLVTPYGLGTARAGFDVLSLGPGLGVIDEWQSPNFGSLGAYELVLLIGLVLLLSSGFRMSLPRAIVLTGLTYLSLTAVRHASLLGLVGPLLVARPLADHLRVGSGETLGAGRVVRTVALSSLAAVVVALPLYREVSPPDHVTPAAAVMAVEAQGLTRVMNDYPFGGFLIYEGVPTFIDSRAELYGGPAVARFSAAVQLDPTAALEDLLETEGVQATMLRPSRPAVEYLDASPDWERVFADTTAVVHRRADGSSP